MPWGTRRNTARRVEEAQRHIEVLARDAMWCLDATHLGRDDVGEAVDAEVVRDAGTRAVLVPALGHASDGDDVVRLLEAAAVERGGLPLVVLTDNGPPYVSEVVETWLAERRVVHLRTLPHTPQHNACGERANGELKQRTGLGKGVQIASLDAVWRELETACATLAARPRACLGGRTSAWMDAHAPVGYHVVPRGLFYEACREAVRRAVEGLTNARARWRAEREAILGTMERVGLIRRTPGGAR